MIRKTRRMSICQQCKTIQRHGAKCSICGSLVNGDIRKITGEDYELEERRTKLFQERNS